MKNKLFIAGIVTFLTFGSAFYASAAPYYIFQPTILPQSNNAFDIGTSTKVWRNAYITNLCLSGDCKTAWPSGTSGSGTISTSSPLTAGLLVQSTDWNTVANIATSSLNLLTTDVAEGTRLYWTNDRFDTRLTATTTLPALTTLRGITTLGTYDGLLGGNSGVLYSVSTSTLNIGGNAGTATQLATPRNINGVAFDGTAAITITAATSTLFGDANNWTGLQSFANASSTLLSVSGNTWLSNLATPAGTFLAVDDAGKIIATSTPTSGSASTTLLADLNTWANLQTFSTAPKLATLDGLIAGNSGNLYQVASSSLFGFTPASNAITIGTTYPLSGGGDLTSSRTLSLAFGTTTSNTWAGTQTFTNNPVLGTLSGLIAGNSGALYQDATTSLTATSPLALSQPISVIGGSASALSLATTTTSLFSGATGYVLSYNNGWFGTATSSLYSWNGTGDIVRTTSPTLITPALGTPSALVGTNISGTAANLTAGTVTTNANLSGVITSVGNTTSFGSQSAGVLGSPVTGNTAVQATSTLFGTDIYGKVLMYNSGLKYTATSSLYTFSGTGNVALVNSPTFITPALGTPSALVGTNISGTAANLTAGTVTTNANLSGVVTSVGNTTSFGSQTAGVLGNPGTGNTAVQATSTLYGVGTYGSVLTYKSGATWSATSTLNLGLSSFANLNANSVIGNLTGAGAVPTAIATSSLFTLGSGLTQSTTAFQQKENRGFSYATSTAWSATTTIPLGVGYAETWNSIKCFTDAGTLNVDFYYNTTHMTNPVKFSASTTVGTISVFSNATPTAGSKVYVDIGTPASSPTKISCTVQDTI